MQKGGHISIGTYIRTDLGPYVENVAVDEYRMWFSRTKSVSLNLQTGDCR